MSENKRGSNSQNNDKLKCLPIKTTNILKNE